MGWIFNQLSDQNLSGIAKIVNQKCGKGKHNVYVQRQAWNRHVLETDPRLPVSKEALEDQPESLTPFCAALSHSYYIIHVFCFTKCIHTLKLDWHIHTTKCKLASK